MDADGYFAQIANTPETTKLYDTVVTWWDAIEALVITGATTARVEAANTSIKNIKRTGRGFRNAENYRTPVSFSPAPREPQREHPPHQSHSPPTAKSRFNVALYRGADPGTARDEASLEFHDLRFVMVMIITADLGPRGSLIIDGTVHAAEHGAQIRSFTPETDWSHLRAWQGPETAGVEKRPEGSNPHYTCKCDEPENLTRGSILR